MSSLMELDECFNDSGQENSSSTMLKSPAESVDGLSSEELLEFIKKLKEENEALKSCLVQAPNNDEQLFQSLKEKCNETVNKDSDLASIITERDSLKGSLVQYQHKVMQQEEFEEELLDYKKKLSKKKAEAEKLQASNEKLKSSVSTLESEKTKLTKKIEMLEKTSFLPAKSPTKTPLMSIKDQEIKQLKQLLIDTETELMEARRGQSTDKSQTDAAEQIAAFRLRLNNIMQEKQQLSAELADKSNENQNLMQIMQVKDSELMRLIGESQNTALLADQLKASRLQSTDQAQQIACLSSEVSAKDEETKNTKLLVAEKVAELSAAKKEIEKLQGEIEEEKKNSKRMLTYSQYNNFQKQERERLMQELENCNKEIKELKIMLKEKESKHSIHKDENENLRAEIERLNASALRLLQHKENGICLSESHRAMEEESKILKRFFEEKVSEVMQLRAEKNKLQLKLESMMAKVPEDNGILCLKMSKSPEIIIEPTKVATPGPVAVKAPALISPTVSVEQPSSTCVENVAIQRRPSEDEINSRKRRQSFENDEKPQKAEKYMWHGELASLKRLIANRLSPLPHRPPRPIRNHSKSRQEKPQTETSILNLSGPLQQSSPKTLSQTHQINTLSYDIAQCLPENPLLLALKSLQKLTHNRHLYKQFCGDLVCVLQDSCVVSSAASAVQTILFYLTLVLKSEHVAAEPENCHLIEQCLAEAILCVDQNMEDHLHGLVSTFFHECSSCLVQDRTLTHFSVTAITYIFTLICKEVKNNSGVRELCANVMKLRQDMYLHVVIIIGSAWSEIFKSSPAELSTDEDLTGARVQCDDNNIENSNVLKSGDTPEQSIPPFKRAKTDPGRDGLTPELNVRNENLNFPSCKPLEKCKMQEDFVNETSLSTATGIDIEPKEDISSISSRPSDVGRGNNFLMSRKLAEKGECFSEDELVPHGSPSDRLHGMELLVESPESPASFTEDSNHLELYLPKLSENSVITEAELTRRSRDSMSRCDFGENETSIANLANRPEECDTDDEMSDDSSLVIDCDDPPVKKSVRDLYLSESSNSNSPHASSPKSKAGSPIKCNEVGTSYNPTNGNGKLAISGIRLLLGDVSDVKNESTTKAYDFNRCVDGNGHLAAVSEPTKFMESLNSIEKASSLLGITPLDQDSVSLAKFTNSPASKTCDNAAKKTQNATKRQKKAAKKQKNAAKKQKNKQKKKPVQKKKAETVAPSKATSQPDLAKTISPNVTSELSTVLETFEQLRFQKTTTSKCLKNLSVVLVNPVLVPNTDYAVSAFIHFLSSSKRNPLMSFLEENDCSVLVPLIEKCLVESIILVDRKRKIHLSGLVDDFLKTAEKFILRESSRTDCGILALCRTCTLMYTEKKDSEAIRYLAYQLLRFRRTISHTAIASMLGVNLTIVQSSSGFKGRKSVDKVWSSVLMKRPAGLTDVQWKQCSTLFVKACRLVEHDLKDDQESAIDIGDCLLQVTEKNSEMKEYERALELLALKNGWEWSRDILISIVIFKAVNPLSSGSLSEKTNIEALAAFVRLLAFIDELSPVEDKSCPAFFGENFKKFIGSTNAAYLTIYEAIHICLFRMTIHHKETIPLFMKEWLEQHQNNLSQETLEWLHMQ